MLDSLDGIDLCWCDLEKSSIELAQSQDILQQVSGLAISTLDTPQ